MKIEFEVVAAPEESTWMLDSYENLPMVYGTTVEERDYCNFGRCKEESDIVHTGLGYCDKHFAHKFCQEPEPPEEEEGVTWITL